ncbi:DUF4232 domain-containing protein [Actinokineospora sp. NBRC 105648]|uniref:DUF4232 domain-containing protein n=1 Tax=Actinokineospora sp. NBRC 105648 TaxID=3032206 RepID=UPI0024A2099D|nr:DUF4232 domain-containing protein [Actinokineospora sp. NBRC 105648]GLZ43111.1 hypothetical protein Acsp05_67350 [Actinokineospora sp. NBRC 105648]
MRKAVIAGGFALVALVAGCAGKDTATPLASSLPPSSATVGSPTTTDPSAVPTTSPTAVPEQPATTQPEDGVGSANDCKAAELKLSIRDGDGAAGTVYRKLVFTNAGTRTCVIQGFPGISYVAGEDGHQVGPAAFRVGTKGAPVTLAPGASASTDVGFVNVQNFDPAVCKPTDVRGLRVYPPHDTASMFVAVTGQGCAGTPPGNQLTVKTVV